MGPNQDHLKQIQRDAVATTIRHFRDEIEDETFVTDVDLDKVKKDLIKDIDESGNANVDDKSNPSTKASRQANTAAQPDSSGKSAGGAAPSREAVKNAKPTNKTSDSRQ